MRTALFTKSRVLWGCWEEHSPGQASTTHLETMCCYFLVFSKVTSLESKETNHTKVKVAGKQTQLWQVLDTEHWCPSRGWFSHSGSHKLSHTQHQVLVPTNAVVLLHTPFYRKLQERIRSKKLKSKQVLKWSRMEISKELVSDDFGCAWEECPPPHDLPFVPESFPVCVSIQSHSKSPLSHSHTVKINCNCVSLRCLFAPVGTGAGEHDGSWGEMEVISSTCPLHQGYHGNQSVAVD